MKNNDNLVSNLKKENKNKVISKNTQKPQNNINQINTKPNILIKEVQKRNKEIPINKHFNNLNSFSELNNLQNYSYQVDVSNTNYNYINKNIKNSNTPFLSNKPNKVIFQNRNNDKIKQTVNLSKNIEEIIKRRILDKQKNTNESKKRTKKEKIDNFSNSKTTKVKNLKNKFSLNKKGNPVNRGNDSKKEKEEEIINHKYYETKRISLSFERDKISEDKNEQEKEEEVSKIYNITNLNYNTEEISSEKIYKCYEHSNSLRGMNYDYDSCIEDDLKSHKKNYFNSQSRSYDKKEKNNFTYDSIYQENISNYDEYKKTSKKNTIKSKKLENKNEKNKIIQCIEINSENSNIVENLNERLNIVKDNKNKENNFSDSKNKAKRNNKFINTIQNNSTVNSTNTNINLTENNFNGEKIKLSNKSIEKINIKKKEVENIQNIISTAIKNVDTNLNNSKEINIDKQNNKNKPNKNNNSISENSTKLENSQLNPYNSKFNSFNNDNKKQNIYAPKKISKYLSIKNNNNNNNNNEFNNNKINKNENNKSIENLGNENNINSQRIAYSKKLAPSITYFQKNFNSKNLLDSELNKNQTEIKYIKNKANFKKLNSNFEGTNNLQMNNIFMNNNIYSNNFNFEYKDSNLFLNTEISNNCCYNLNSNTNPLFYEITSPSTQLFFQMNNNNTKNMNKIPFLEMNNSFNNYRNNYIVPINDEKFFNEKIQINNNKGLLNHINFEDFIILETRLNDIKHTLSKKNPIVNECFEYLNYFYNSTIIDKIDYLFGNNIDSNNLKICLGYNLLSIIVSYNCSLDIKIFEQTYLLLKEVLDINYKNLILLYEYILEKIQTNNNINIKTNIWLLKMKNIINIFKRVEDKNTYNEYISLNKNNEMTIYEKIKINTNFIMNNINIVLGNIKTKNNEYLISIFKSMDSKLIKDIFFYFFNYIIYVPNSQGSILGSILSKNNLLNNNNEILPYIKTKNVKKYSVVLDIEETLLHFNNKGVVNIRPGAHKFMNDISEYYELIAFNEGEQKYTDLLIDSLEENKIFFEHRFYRQHIIIDNSDIVKDLNRIGRPLDKILIIDNMMQNFKFQKTNGILIKSFWGDNPNDDILNDLSFILMKIAKEGGDIRNGLIKYKNEIIDKITIGNNNIV